MSGRVPLVAFRRFSSGVASPLTKDGLSEQDGKIAVRVPVSSRWPRVIRRLRRGASSWGCCPWLRRQSGRCCPPQRRLLAPRQDAGAVAGGARGTPCRGSGDVRGPARRAYRDRRGPAGTRPRGRRTRSTRLVTPAAGAGPAEVSAGAMRSLRQCSRRVPQSPETPHALSIRPGTPPVPLVCPPRADSHSRQRCPRFSG